jgi:hypothetical protein
MPNHSRGANYNLSRTEKLIGWLFPLLVGVGSILGVFFLKGNFGETLRQFFLVR